MGEHRIPGRMRHARNGVYVRWVAMVALAALTLGARGAVADGSEGKAGRSRLRSTPVDPRTRQGGGLHHDEQLACAACSVLTRRLLHHLDRPVREDISRTVTELSDPNDPESTVEVPYVKSARFLQDAMRRTCGDHSLATIMRHTTWIGDVTYATDDVPWGDPEHADPPIVDADLALACKRLMQHYKRELESAMAAREPWSACVALRCDDVDTSIIGVTAHTIARMIVKPWLMVKTAPVFVAAFVFPWLWRPVFFPPADPDRIAMKPGENEKMVQRAQASAGLEHFGAMKAE